MRSRTIKPGFYDNEVLGSISPLAHLLFPGLWQMADHEGLMEYRPLRIKAKIFPYRDADVASLCDELESGGLIDRYDVDGCMYLSVVGFLRHQRPHPNEKKIPSIIPKKTHQGTSKDIPSSVHGHTKDCPDTEEGTSEDAPNRAGSSGSSGPSVSQSASPPDEKTADAEQRAILAARRRKVIDAYNPIAERNDWFVVDGKPNGTAMDLLNKFCEDEYRFGKLDEYMSKVDQSTMEACRINAFLTKKAFNGIMCGTWIKGKEPERKGGVDGPRMPEEALDLSKPWNRAPEPEKRSTGIWDNPEGLI